MRLRWQKNELLTIYIIDKQSIARSYKSQLIKRSAEDLIVISS